MFSAWFPATYFLPAPPLPSESARQNAAPSSALPAEIPRPHHCSCWQTAFRQLFSQSALPHPENCLPAAPLFCDVLRKGQSLLLHNSPESYCSKSFTPSSYAQTHLYFQYSTACYELPFFLFSKFIIPFRIRPALPLKFQQYHQKQYCTHLPGSAHRHKALFF